MSDYSDDEIVKVEKNDSKKKNISIKNIEPINGIQIIRDDSDSDSLSSDLSSMKDHHHRVKKTKKVLRRKENKLVIFWFTKNDNTITRMNSGVIIFC